MVHKTNEAQQWESVGSIDIGERLSISDTSYFYDEPLVVPIDSGNYIASIQYLTVDGHEHVAGLRVAMPSGVLRRGQLLGSVPIDFGQIGICDRDATETAFDHLGDERMSNYYDQLNTTDLMGWVALPNAVKMLIARPGFGDGMYPVYEVIRPDGTRAGIEVDCVR